MAYVSVIIPTFNRAQLLARCLASLVASGVPDLEIIVVDDGGTDDSKGVCKSFGATYLRQENAGPAAARNLGYAASSGTYVGFIDSDDEWINGGARRLAAQLDANPEVDIVFADSQMGNQDDGFVSFVGTYGGRAFDAVPHELREGGLRVLQRQSFLLALSTRNVMFLGSMVFRRRAFDALAGFNRDLCGAADWDVFMRAAVNCTVAFSEGPAVSLYYKHGDAMSANADHMESDFIRALESVHTTCSLDHIERSHIEHRIREHVFGWAYRAYEAGQLGLARERLQQARHLGKLRARERIYLMATYLPAPVLGALRRVKHSVGV